MSDELLPSSTISGGQTESPTKLVINLDDGDDTDELTALFDMGEATLSVTKVVVHSSAEETEDWVDEDMLSFLFACLGELENLEQLHINLGGMRLPVRLLADVVEQSPQLQMLCVDSVSLTDDNAGDQDDDDDDEEEEEDNNNNEGVVGANFRDLSEAVRDQTALAYVCLSDIKVVEAQNQNNDDEDDNGNADGFVHVNWNPASQLEPFLVSLAFDCPNMKALALDGVPASATALQAMASSPYLRQLEFWSVPGVNDHIVNIAKAIEGNKVLQKLELCECQLGPLAAQEMTRMLQNNNILQSVVLEMEWDPSAAIGKDIASVLKDNQKLTNLHLICHQRESEHSASQQQPGADTERHADLICRDGLAANTSLKRFGLEFRQPRAYRMNNNRLKRAFAEPLRQVLLSNNNVVLETFSVRGGTSVFPVVWEQETEFYLQLNGNGLRRQWLWQQQQEQPGKEEEKSCCKSHDWMIKILLDHKEDDLSTLFYLLSAHPHLLSGL